MNKQIENTKNFLVNDINNSNLPVGVVLLIVKDLMHELEDCYKESINNEEYFAEEEIIDLNDLKEQINE